MNPSQLSLGVAFIAGLVSFLSPCVLPLVPIYLAQLVGKASSSYRRTSATSCTPEHVLSFSNVCRGLYACICRARSNRKHIRRISQAHQLLLRQIGGVLLVIIGLHLAGILKLPFLYWQKRFEFHPHRPNYVASLLVRFYFRGWLDTVYWLDFGRYPWHGSKHGHTGTGRYVAAFLLARSGGAISVTWAWAKSFQRLPKVAQAASWENRDCYRSSYDFVWRHHLF